MATELQNLTGVSDESIMKSQAIVQAHIGQTKVTRELSLAIMNLAAAKKMDLSQAAELVGKAIEGNTTMLKKYGLEIVDNQSKTERLSAIIDAINGKYKNQAQAMGQGLGALNRLKQVFDDFQESLGERFAPIIVSITNYIIKLMNTFKENKALADFVASIMLSATIMSGLVLTIGLLAKAFIVLNGVLMAAGIQIGAISLAVKSMANSRGTVIPSGVEINITRNYGETANDKVNELIEHLTLAVIIVVGLIGFVLGWREAIIVVAAVPITFALTLLINYLAGYSINRVTLFALILSLGLVVDDPIVDVENIFRHFKMRKEPPLRAVLTAVNEVRPPVILATLVVILSFVPMLFITGMMGPYMRPMALNVPVAMLMSMVVAFTITPWMSYHVLKSEYGKKEETFVLQRSLIYRFYRVIISPFLAKRGWAWLLIFMTVVLFSLSVLLPVTGRVPLKMLPFDNKNEFQIVVDMPRGTTLETTDAAVKALAGSLHTVPEVTNFVTFVGTASPMDFNGMVRHYYLRRGPDVGEIRVNLVKKDYRQQQSHAILLRLRKGLTRIGRAHGANIKLVESPPGPPVFATLVAEVYGRPEKSYQDLIAAAGHVRKLMDSEPGVVDVDDTVEADQFKYLFVVDKVKASLSGISNEIIGATMRLAEEGYSPGEDMPLSIAAGSGVLHTSRDLNPVPIVLRLSRAQRSSLADLSQLSVKTAAGKMLRLVELGRFDEVLAAKTIYHKNLRCVVYVYGDVAGQSPVNAILGLESGLEKSPVAEGISVVWSGEGEWKITLDVFRDLGIAFAGALLGIYILQVWQTGSYIMPLVLMVSIPLTVIGIMPGFWLLDVLGNHPVGGYSNPVFFTATAMIGMIALSGLADRNAILLIEFVHAALERGMSLKDALIESGAVRLRPIVLTSGAAMLGAWPITLDPVFSGLAWALIFGLVVSTAFTLILIPVIYWLLYANAPRHGLPDQTPLE